jgi:hypothetical protein
MAGHSDYALTASFWGSPNGIRGWGIGIRLCRFACVSTSVGMAVNAGFSAFPQVVHCNVEANHGLDVAVFFLICGGVTIPPDNTILMAMGTERSVS